MIIKRFADFAEAENEWKDLEANSTHYPFQAFWYQKLFAETFCKPEDIFLLGFYENNELVAIGGFEKIDEGVILLGMKPVLGGEELTDYGDMLFSVKSNHEDIKQIWSAVVDYFKERKISKIQLDYVRKDSETFKAISENLQGGQSIAITGQEVAPYILIPDSWEAYLTSLRGKQRHELKRKLKRLEEQRAFHFCSDKTVEKDFEEFIRLLRISNQSKEKFMSGEMKQFFRNMVIAGKKDFSIEFCFLEIDGKRVASIMSMIGQGKALIYNSGTDPEYNYYSAGLILHAYLIKKSITQRLITHDFLRGNERYKYDLGAKDMHLYRVMLN